MRVSKKVVATGLTCALASALLLGSVEYASHTYAAERLETTVQKETNTVMAGAADEKDSKKLEKEESVYVTLESDGKIKKVIVSDWLKNSGINGTIQDFSELKDIQNTKGNEKFTQDGNSLTWEAGDEDIYYQGTTEKELPIGVHFSYKLDGEKIEPKDLIGKSGKLEMKIKYTNKSAQTVKIGGKDKEIYTPFLLATGMFMPVENFSNVKVDNGRVLSEGDNDIVVAYGMPGLKESLDLDSLDFGEDSDIKTDDLEDKLTDTVTITADVKDFELGQTYTLATPNLFSKLDFDEIEDADDLEDKLDDLTDASEKLVDGSDKINDGLQTLDDSFDKYEAAIKKLQKGVKKLSTGSKEIDKAAKAYTGGTDKILSAVAAYADGTKTFAQGEKAYNEAAKTLVDGIGEIYSGAQSFPASYTEFDKKLSEYMTGVNTLLSKENMDSLKTGASALKAGVDTINESASALNKSKDEVNTAIAGMEELVKNYKALASAETDATQKATYEQMAAQLEKAVAGTKQYVEGAEQFAAGVAIATNGTPDGELDGEGTKDLAAGLATLKTSADAMAENAEKIRAAKEPLETASGEIKAGISTLVGSLEKAKTGGNTLVGNNAKLKQGANTLISNSGALNKNAKKITKNSPAFRKATKTLAAGVSTLLSGVNTLTDKTGDVSDGIGKLSKGSDKLYDGVKEFKSKAIDKLGDTLDDLLDGVTDFQDTAEAISDASKNYKSFSGISDKMDGNVKFIMTTDELRASDED